MVLTLHRDQTGVLTLPTETRPVRWERAAEDAITVMGERARFDLVVDIRDLFPSRVPAPRWGGCGTVDEIGFLVAGTTDGDVLRVERVEAPP